MNDKLDLLDVLTILSFALQLQNQGRIIDLKDVQGEINRAVDNIHAHLEAQDKKIDRIMEALYEDHQETV